MKFFFDLFPIILFFAAYKFYDIYTATAVAIGATVAQIAWVWLKHRKVDTMLWVSFGLVLIFGGATLLLKDKSFIMWKATVLHWLFAAAFLIPQLIGKGPLIKKMLPPDFTMPDQVWGRLNFAWAAFFLALGAGNIYFVQNYAKAEVALRDSYPAITKEQIQELKRLDCSTTFKGNTVALCQAAQEKEAMWANYKVPITMSLMVVFIILQAFYLGRYLQFSDAPSDKLVDSGRKP